MKSDREFLDGIYEKAAKINAETNLAQTLHPQGHKKVPVFRIAMAAASFVLIGTGLISGILLMKKNPGSAVSPQAISARGELSGLYEKPVLGKTVKISCDGDAKYAEIEVEQAYGVETGKLLLVKYYEDDMFTQDEAMVVFVSPDYKDGDAYILSDASDSVYSFLEKENGVRYFCRKDGTCISEEDLKVYITES